MKTMKFRAAALAIAAGWLCAGSPAMAGQDDAPPLEGLARVFAPGPILQDRNGDDQVDFVNVRIILPNTPEPGDVGAAVAVAARLGMETSGMTLPLVFRAADFSSLASGPPAIVIGAGNELLPRAVTGRIESLEEGQGAVMFLDGDVFIAGKDAAGTQAAGEAFAGRSPYLWNVIGREHGETFERIARHLRDALAESEIAVESVSIDELIYAADKREAVGATATARVAARAVGEAHAKLEEIAERHRRGEATDRLNYASAAEMTFRVSDGRETRAVTMARVGVPGRVLNPSRRPPTRFATPGGRGGRGARGGGGGARGGRRFDLTNLYSADEGLLGDEDGDRIPDNTNVVILYPESAFPAGDAPARGVTQLAARLGLESTGLRLPLFGFDKELEDPSTESRMLVLVGRQNRHVRELARTGRLRAGEAGPGIGRVEMVPSAFRGNSVVTLTGGDLAGEEAAADYLARRAPYLWEIGRGKPTLTDARERVRKLLTARSAPGQAALAVEELERIVEELEDKELESISIDVYLEEEAPEFGAWLARRYGPRFKTDAFEVKTHRKMDPEEVFVQKPELEWEVDAFWTLFREKVAEIEEDTVVSVELRVSEAPELRRELEDEIRAEIERLGGEAGEVRVLSAYKQGLSWLTDRVAPELEGKPVATLRIGWKPFPIDLESKERFQNEPARWLNELYPADDVLAAQMELPLEAFSFQALEEGEAIYTVIARDGFGNALFEDSFSPKFYERPYLDAYPDYATVTVTTGWLRVTAGEETLVDERIATDSDRIWDHFQSETLSAVSDHIRKAVGGRPTRQNAPFFHTLRVELKASEPDYRLGIDEEHVSALESLHDDIYFDSLDFFSRMTEAPGATGGGRSLAPGNVMPWIHPERRGEAPELTITLSGFKSKEAKVVVKYVEVKTEEEIAEEAEARAGRRGRRGRGARGGAEGRGARRGGRGGGEEEQEEEAGDEETEEEEDEGETITRTLGPLTVPAPYLYLAEVRDRREGLERLGFLIEMTDGGALSSAAALLDNLDMLQGEGLFEDALALANVRRVEIRLEAPGALSARTYDSPPVADEAPEALAYPAMGGLVTWDHVISPAESESIAHTLGTLPNVTTWVAGRSYQGRPVSVMEIIAPMEAELVSQAKLNTWKPVLSIVGRQHANEVSSTSHILRLAELLATDPAYAPYLKKINFVIQPVVNPDGAALAYELQKLTPTHCLHAGRYSALGPDVNAGLASDPDTLVSEAKVLREINRRWVADVSLNPHGYPSHEWVHQFANYNPKSFRSYWIPRGWWTNVREIEDPRRRDYQDIVLAMRDYIADEVNKNPEGLEANRRIHDRYNRWAIRWQPHVYNLEIYRDTAIYASRRGGGASLSANPALTRPLVFSGMTEAMDETAQGEWLDLVSQMGFGFLMASVRFLDEAQYELYRLEGTSGIGVRLAVTRPRPIRAGRAPAEAPPPGE